MSIFGTRHQKSQIPVLVKIWEQMRNWLKFQQTTRMSNTKPNTFFPGFTVLNAVLPRNLGKLEVEESENIFLKIILVDEK